MEEQLTYRQDGSEQVPGRERPRGKTSLISRVGGRMRMVALAAFLAGSGAGCATPDFKMYSPEYKKVFKPTSVPLEEQEMANRKKVMEGIMADPTQEETTIALQSGIEEFQRDRLRDNFKPLTESVDLNDFVNYAQLCEEVKYKLGIMNPDRYSPAFLAEVLRNYESAEVNRGKPVAFVVVSRKDTDQGGVQILNTQAHELEAFTQQYKVILVETSDFTEINHHILTLARRGVLHENGLAHQIFLCHEDSDDGFKSQTGLELMNMIDLTVLNRFWITTEIPQMTFAFCYSGQGGKNGADGISNFSNYGALSFPRVRAVASNGKFVQFGLRKKPDGHLENQPFTFFGEEDYPKTNSTYTTENTPELLQQACDTYSAMIGDAVPKDFIRLALQMGVLRKCEIEQAYQEKSLVRFEPYRLLGMCFGDFNRLVKEGVTHQLAEAYRKSGALTGSEILICRSLEITPAHLQRFQELLERKGFDYAYCGPLLFASICSSTGKTPNDILSDGIDRYLASKP